MPQYMARYPWMNWPHNLKFRPSNRPPVAGGRWNIRRNPQTGRWHAWSNGKASIHRHTFETHAQAIEYATAVARLFAIKTLRDDPELRRRMAKAIYEGIRLRVKTI